ncbi:MAG: methionyl-tRNA formyltransferase [Planctomycetota bacterium]|nr:methionyl-tRNA formyltransferase [Planctomycetota bacterium]
MSTPEELAGAVEGTAPRFAFFLHWAWKVPSLLLAQLECVGFHMTDLPYGRGGSPLQNLILRGHRNTVLTAFRLTHELDAGPVYLKAPLSLDGRAEEIYRRATALAASMIARIVREEPRPTPQEGVVTTFRRRRPEESELPQDLAPADAYDFIRMLDADGYPHAFVRAGAWTIELTHPVRDGETIKARAVLRKGATPQ